MTGRLSALAAAVLTALAAAPAFAQAACPPVELRYDENEQLQERRADTNKDCRQDEFVYYNGGIAERAERDTNFDGRVDVFLFYEEDGKTPARQPGHQRRRQKTDS